MTTIRINDKHVITERIILFLVYFRNGSGWASEQRELQQRQPEQRRRRVRDRKYTPQRRYVTSHIGPIGATTRAGDSLPGRVIKRVGGSNLRAEAGENRPMEPDLSLILGKHSEKLRGGVWAVARDASRTDARSGKAKAIASGRCGTERDE